MHNTIVNHTHTIINIIIIIIIITTTTVHTVVIEFSRQCRAQSTKHKRVFRHINIALFPFVG